jgi:hypothetical protein
VGETFFCVSVDCVFVRDCENACVCVCVCVCLCVCDCVFWCIRMYIFMFFSLGMALHAKHAYSEWNFPLYMIAQCGHFTC